MATMTLVPLKAISSTCGYCPRKVGAFEEYGLYNGLMRCRDCIRRNRKTPLRQRLAVAERLEKMLKESIKKQIDSQIRPELPEPKTRGRRDCEFCYARLEPGDTFTLQDGQVRCVMCTRRGLVVPLGNPVDVDERGVAMRLTQTLEERQREMKRRMLEPPPAVRKRGRPRKMSYTEHPGDDLRKSCEEPLRKKNLDKDPVRPIRQSELERILTRLTRLEEMTGIGPMLNDAWQERRDTGPEAEQQAKLA